MKVKTYFVIGLACAVCCYVRQHLKNTRSQSQADSEDKEIKMEDVDDQLKRIRERMDSVKKALGIE